MDWIPLELRALDTDSDGAEQARWLEHPVYGRLVDVVAIPLAVPPGVTVFPYEAFDPSPQLLVSPSSDLSIIGFPFGRTGGGYLGIWVKGFVASEPDLDFESLPRFLVDARTRQGQSGSPVVAYNDGTGVAAFANHSVTMGVGRPVVNLLGVYSGRINPESDLGYVWKTQVIRDILMSQTPGRPGL